MREQVDRWCENRWCRDLVPGKSGTPKRGSPAGSQGGNGSVAALWHGMVRVRVRVRVRIRVIIV